MELMRPGIYILLLLIPCRVWANVRLPAVIADNMVLQQSAKVAIWGWADPGEKITVSDSWGHRLYDAFADANGRWQLRIRTAKAGGPYTLTISGKNTIRIQNILLGEIWLCSGQSNMTFPLEKEASWRTGVYNYEQEIAAANYPDIRMFIVEQTVADTPQQEVKGKWQICSPATAGKFSAVAYYFAREIVTRTGRPVGLIHASWGGTPAESWVKREVLESDPDLPRMGVHPTTDPKSPAVLYNGMIHPLVPYTLKGIIWYQGESNSDRATQYRKLFPALIDSWRKDWQADLPFYFVQIAPHGAKKPEIREAQLFAFRSVPKTGMAVITDAADSIDIHPRNKEIPGKRLALWALAKEYGQKNIVYAGPVYRSMKIDHHTIKILFDYAKDGLMSKEGGLKEFMIAGDDRKFVPAQARIAGNTVIVWAEEVKNPVAVRYAWKNFPRPNLYNNAGLPASPFRTDDWPTE